MCAAVCLRVSLLGEAQNIWFGTMLSDIWEIRLSILLYVAAVVLKTRNELYTSLRQLFEKIPLHEKLTSLI